MLRCSFSRCVEVCWFRRLLLSTNPKWIRFMSNSEGRTDLKVTILGAAGDVGQPLALLLKQSPFFKEIALYDITCTKGISLDIGQVDTKTKVTAFSGLQEIGEALKGTNIVVMTAGKSEDEIDVFRTNASIVRDLAFQISKYAPLALVNVVTNPINSLVPVVAEVLKSERRFDPKRLFGVTTLDVVRANTFLAQATGLLPESVIVPVIGGHSSSTIVPVFSRATPDPGPLSQSEMEKLREKVCMADRLVMKAKGRSGHASLGMAFATARFIISQAKGLSGVPSVIECAYVSSEAIKDLRYLCEPVLLGPKGVSQFLGVPKLSDYEQTLLNQAVPHLQNDINEGIKFVLGEHPISFPVEFKTTSLGKTRGTLTTAQKSTPPF